MTQHSWSCEKYLWFRLIFTCRCTAGWYKCSPKAASDKIILIATITFQGTCNVSRSRCWSNWIQVQVQVQVQGTRTRTGTVVRLFVFGGRICISLLFGVTNSILHSSFLKKHPYLRRVPLSIPVNLHQRQRGARVSDITENSLTKTKERERERTLEKWRDDAKQFCGGVDTDVIFLIWQRRSDEMLKYLHTSAEPFMRDFAKQMLAGGTFTFTLIPNQDQDCPSFWIPSTHPMVYDTVSSPDASLITCGCGWHACAWYWYLWKGKWFLVKFPFYQTISQADSVPRSSPYFEPSTTTTATDKKQQALGKPRKVSMADYHEKQGADLSFALEVRKQRKNIRTEKREEQHQENWTDNNSKPALIDIENESDHICMSMSEFREGWD